MLDFIVKFDLGFPSGWWESVDLCFPISTLWYFLGHIYASLTYLRIQISHREPGHVYEDKERPISNSYVSRLWRFLPLTGRGHLQEFGKNASDLTWFWMKRDLRKTQSRFPDGWGLTLDWLPRPFKKSPKMPIATSFHSGTDMEF